MDKAKIVIYARVANPEQRSTIGRRAFTYTWSKLPEKLTMDVADSRENEAPHGLAVADSDVNAECA
jgi:hypothetical protein